MLKHSLQWTVESRHWRLRNIESPLLAAYNMRMKPFPALLIRSLLLAMLLAAPLAAARDLYVGQVPLEGQAAVTPADLTRALDQVLVRLTGMVDESPAAAIGLAPADVTRLLVSQQRVRVSRLDLEGQSTETLWLRAEFYPQGVDQLLQRHDLPRLGPERPAILLWVAVDDYDSGAELLDDSVIEQAVTEQSVRLGLDVFRPLGDALDMAEVQLADIRGGFLDAAETGAQRYGAGMIAMLDLREEDDYWTARWFWRLEGRDSGISLSADHPADLVGPGLEAILAAMTARYAVHHSGDLAGVRRVVVEGIVDEIQYAEVLGYLEGLSVVESLRVVGARDRQVEFELSLAGGGLEDLIALSRLLAVDRQLPDGRLMLRLAR